MSADGGELIHGRIRGADGGDGEDGGRDRDGVAGVPQRSASADGRWRWVTAIVLVVLTGVLTVVAVPALYLRAVLLDTDRYVAIVAPLAADPAVQREIAATVTGQITTAADLEGTTRDALTGLTADTPRVAPLITGLAPALAAQLEGLVGTTATTFVESPQFEELWIRLNRTAHQALMNRADGSTGGTVVIEESGAVTITSREIVVAVKDRLLQQGVGIAAGIPEIDARITLFHSPELVRVAQALGALDRAAPLLAGLSILGAVCALAVAPRGRRRRVTGLLGLVLAVAMALLILGLAAGRGVYLTLVPPGAVSPAAAESLLDALITPLRTSARLTLVVGLAVSVIAFLGGPSRTATRLRRRLVGAGDAVIGRTRTGSDRPWRRSLARHRLGGQAAVVGVALLLLVFWPDPSAAMAGVTLAVVVLLVLAVEVQCRPAATRPTTEPPAGAAPLPPVRRSR